MDLIKTIEEKQRKPDAENFKVGDNVKVYFKIVEGKAERIQIYEGLVLCIKNAGVRKTFTVRKTSYGVGVERVFPMHSPRVIKVEVTRPGKIRRSKIYYIRDKIGAGSKIKELLGGNVAARVAAANAAADAAAAKEEAAIKAEAKAENAAAAANPKKK